jgi:hypothetical protein
MQSKATTVEAYLQALPEDRREVLLAIRATILKNLPKGYQEGMQYGMIGYYVPHEVYPPGYHCDPKQPLPFLGLASQKNHMSLYLMCVYGDPDQEAWFRKAWTATGKKLDMGKSCVRFKRLEDVPLVVVGQAVKRVPVRKFIEHYETVLQSIGRKTNTPRKKKVAEKKTAKKKTVKTKTAAKKSSASKSSSRRTSKKKTKS